MEQLLLTPYLGLYGQSDVFERSLDSALTAFYRYYLASQLAPEKTDSQSMQEEPEFKLPSQSALKALLGALNPSGESTQTSLWEQAQKGLPQSEADTLDALSLALCDADVQKPLNQVRASLKHQIWLLAAVQTLRRHYFQKGYSLLEDVQYDVLAQGLSQLGALHPDLAAICALKSEVGAAPIQALSKFRHDTPMLSLGNVFGPQEVDAFCRLSERELLGMDHPTLGHSAVLLFRVHLNQETPHLELLTTPRKELSFAWPPALASLPLPKGLKSFDLLLWSDTPKRLQQALESDDSTLIEHLGRHVISYLPLKAHQSELESIKQAMSHWQQDYQKMASGYIEALPSYVCEPKFDGIAVSVLYQEGKRVRAVTRGDGKVGEIITQTIGLCQGLPTELAAPFPSHLEVRGEAYIHKADLKAMNEIAQKEGGMVYQNPRNATSGLLRRLKPLPQWQDKIQLTLYDALPLTDGKPLASTHSEALRALQAMGLPASTPYLAKGEQQIHACYQELLDGREAAAYEMDGMVIKLDRYSHRDTLGSLSKAPRWATAYKFPPSIGVSVLLEVVWQVGRTGILTPVASLEPVALDGVTIRSVTLHNHDYIESMGLALQDTVKIHRAGGVIPQLLQVVKPGKSGSIIRPTHCPSCQGTLSWSDKQTRCMNVDCPARRLESLVYFASRPGLDIEGFGRVTITQLFHAGALNQPSDFYQLTKEKLEHLSRPQEGRPPQLSDVSTKKIAAMLAGIEQSRHHPLPRWLSALGIEELGPSESLALCRKYLTLEQIAALTNSTEEAPLSVVETKVAAFFADDRFKAMVQSLLKAGFADRYQNLQSTGTLSGMRLVITGTLSKPRAAMKAYLESHGAIVGSSVSSKTDYLIAGEASGSNLEKANKLSVPVLDEKGLEAMIQNKAEDL